MSIEQLKTEVLNDIQHYYNKEQVIALLDKIKPTTPIQTTLF